MEVPDIKSWSSDRREALDPRVKLFWLVGSSFVLFSSNLPFVFAGLSITTLAFILSKKRKQEQILVKATPLYLIFYFAVTFLLILLLLQDVRVAFLIGFKLLTIAIAALLYFEITRPSEMLESLRSIGVPSSLAIALGVGFRFIPIIFEEAGKILLAQRARGLATGRGIATLLHIRTIIPALAVPLLISIFSRTNELWLAININGARALTAPPKRVFYLTWQNGLVLIYTLLLIGLGIWT